MEHNEYLVNPVNFDSVKVRIQPKRARVDYYCLGHIILGQASFLVHELLLVGTSGFREWSFHHNWQLKGLCVLVTVLFGLLWEPFEIVVTRRISAYHGTEVYEAGKSWSHPLINIGFISLGGIVALCIDNFWANLVIVALEFLAFFFYDRRKRMRIPPAGKHSLPTPAF